MKYKIKYRQGDWKIILSLSIYLVVSIFVELGFVEMDFYRFLFWGTYISLIVSVIALKLIDSSKQK